MFVVVVAAEGHGNATGNHFNSKAPFTHSWMRSRMVPDGWPGIILDYSVSAV